ncbi:MAG: DUF4143 domain-containing protein, partial [Bacteroidota bacterium]
NLWLGYKDDIEKYAKNRSERNIIRYLMHSANNLNDRISFSKIANQQYTSKSIAEAFRAIDQARIIQLRYPITNVIPPLNVNRARRPKAQFLDTGLLNFMQSNLSDLLMVNDLNEISKGRLLEHLIIQEVQAQFSSPLYKSHFWVREKSNSNAEVDLVVYTSKYVIPIETKSGKQGRLRSLHEFMDRTNHPYAIRFLNNYFSKEQAITPKGTKFTLYNLPYYLGSQLLRYLDWILEES